MHCKRVLGIWPKFGMGTKLRPVAATWRRAFVAARKIDFRLPLEFTCCDDAPDKAADLELVGCSGRGYVWEPSFEFACCDNAPDKAVDVELVGCSGRGCVWELRFNFTCCDDTPGEAVDAEPVGSSGRGWAWEVVFKLACCDDAPAGDRAVDLELVRCSCRGCVSELVSF